MDNSSPFPHQKKLVVVGDGASGKTSLLMVYCGRPFPKDYVPTIFDNFLANLDLNGGEVKVALNLWDTAGQEDYDKLRCLSYPGADVILLCFSVDNPSSLRNITSKWYPEVSSHCPGKPILLVGNKHDLRNQSIDSSRDVKLCDETLARSIAKDINAYAYMENSALMNEGVREIFQVATEACVMPRKKKKRSKIRCNLQ